MAVCSKSRDNYLRLLQLLNIGETALRKIFDQLLPPANLQNILFQFEGCITKRRMNKKEHDILFPATDIAESTNMDLSLMVRVLRHTVLQPPSSGFDCEPINTDISLGADVARMKCIRNSFAHHIGLEVDDEEFEKISKTLIEVIKRLCGSDFDNEIGDVMNGSMDSRAISIRWLVLLIDKRVRYNCNETLLQPAIAKVIRLHEERTIYYNSILGGIVLAYGMQIIKVPINGERFNDRGIFENLAVRQTIPILHQIPMLKRKLPQFLFYQQNQDITENMQVDDLRVDGNLFSQEYNHFLHSSNFTSNHLFELELPGRILQYDQIAQTSTIDLFSIAKHADTVIPSKCICQLQDYMKYHRKYQKMYDCRLTRSTWFSNFPESLCERKFVNPYQMSTVTTKMSCTNKDSIFYNDPSKMFVKKELEDRALRVKNPVNLFDVSATDHRKYRSNVVSNISSHNVNQSESKIKDHCYTLISANITKVSPEISIENEVQNEKICWIFTLCVLVLLLVTVWSKPHNVIRPSAGFGSYFGGY